MGQQTTNYDRSILVWGDPRTRTVTVLNPEATTQAIKRGSVLGRIANGNYQVMKSAAADGSQFAKAVLASDISLAASGTAKVQVYISGDFNKSALVLNGTDTLATAVDSQAIEDWMKGQSLFVEEVNELTDYDNQ